MKKIIFLVLAGILFVVPIATSASANVSYQGSVEQPSDVSTSGDVSPNNVAGWFASTVAGWLAGKVYDHVWQNARGEFLHLCLSLPEDKHKEFKEAFSR